MALKSFIHLLASLLLVSTLVHMVSSESEQLLESGIITKVPPQSPLNPPISAAPPVKLPPPPQAPAPVKVSPPPQAPVPVKVPPPPPFVKPPVVVPPSPPVSSSPPPPPRNTKECYPPCVVRCKLHSRQNVCLRACVTCCDRCKCVPPGQFGNKDKCGKCYANMTTHGGKSKCP